MRAYEAAIICLVLGAGVVVVPAGDDVTARRATDTALSPAPAPASGRTGIARLSADFLRPETPIDRTGKVVLSGSQLHVAVVGTPDADIAWRLAHADTVVAGGSAKLNENGQLLLEIVNPSVKHRAACTLEVRHGEQARRNSIVVLPAAMLAHVKRRVADLDIGVWDASGRVRKALKEETVDISVLESSLQQDSFEGGAVVLAGFENVRDLSLACNSLDTRVREGLSVILVNPPVGWSGWGVKVLRPDARWEAPVHAAEGFLQHLHRLDLGTGPWLSLLSAEDAKLLLWTHPPAEQDSPPARPLVIARRVERGTVIVTDIPPLADPAENAIGRALLTDCLHWILLEKSVL